MLEVGLASSPVLSMPSLAALGEGPVLPPVLLLPVVLVVGLIPQAVPSQLVVLAV